MASDKAKIEIDTSVDNSGLKKGLKDSTKAVKDFAKSAGQELLGIDQLLSTVAGGPAAMGKAFVDMGKQAVAALNEMSAMFREQEQAEIALQNAAKNNPYLNDRSVKQLKTFADEMQRVTGMDSVQVLQTETRLASLGRNQQQIQQIVKTAADLAAAGVMGYDEAVNELSRSLNGAVGRMSGQLVPELKNLTAEELAAGKGIEMLAGKVEGAAAESMKSGAGSTTRFQNAVADLKKIGGEGWENFLRGPREAAAEVAEKIVDTINYQKQLKAANDELNKLSKEQEEEVNRLYEEQNVLLEKRLALHEAYKDTTEVDKRMDNIDKEIEKIKELARTEKIISDAGLFVMQDKLNNALKEQADYQNKVNNMTREGYTESAQRFQTLLDQKTNEINILKFQTGIIEQQLALRGDEEKADAAKKQADNAAMEREETIARFRKENQEALDAEIEKILRKAEIEGKTKDDISVQKQILDAQVTAYENLLVAAKGYINGTAESEKNRYANLKKSWADYEKQTETEKRTDEERKKRLAELTKQQEDAHQALGKINNDLQGEARKLAEEKTQKEINDIREKNAKEGIERQTAYEISKSREASEEKRKQAQEAYQKQADAITALMYKELENAKLTDSQRAEIRKKALEDIQKVTEEGQAAITQIDQNAAAQRLAIEEEANRQLEQADKDSFQRRIAIAQEYINAANQISNSISTIWHNSIDYDTEEKLKANDELIQSDEERAAKEKEIIRKAALEKYKADLFAWNANIIMAEAQMAMAMLNAYAKGSESGAIVAGVQMALAAVVGGMQVAAVVSAMPKPPRFHEGGVVQGRPGQEVPAILKAGEPVLTQQQFQNTMQAISNLAGMRGVGGNAVSLNVNVENRASNTTVDTGMDTEGLKIVIREIVNEQMSNGGLDRGFAGQQLRSRGYDIQT